MSSGACASSGSATRITSYNVCYTKLLRERKYAVLEKKRFVPQDIGMVVSDHLAKHFERYVDYNFTAGLEEELDQVSRGEKQWQQLLGEFWSPFKTRIDQKMTEVAQGEATTEALDENCPECSRPLAVKLGRRGKFSYNFV